MSQVTNVSFSIKIQSGNDAVVSDPHVEVCRILDMVKQKIMDGYVEGFLHDLNGNSLGLWHLGIELDDSDDSDDSEVRRD